MNKRFKVQEPAREGIAQKYNEGEKVEVIAMLFDLHPSNVTRIAREKGCTMRGSDWRRRPVPDAQQVGGGHQQ